MPETFDWLKPSPLWEAGAADMRRQDFFRPALHEFRADTFMDDFLASAAAPTPKRFSDSLAKLPQGRTTLKLFQPVHGCFYLTSASLCCRVPGFPDREVSPGAGESVFFVLRRRVNGVEYAWDVGAAGNAWKPLGGKPVLDTEERLPLFQTPSAAGRNLFFGYVPVASRETYATAPTAPNSPIDFTRDLRLEELHARFIEPLAPPPVATPPIDAPAFGPTNARATGAALIRRITVYLLLDLWEFFETYLEDVARAIRDDTTSTLVGPKRLLTDYLSQQRLGSVNPALMLDAALRLAAQKRAALSGPGDLTLQEMQALGFDSRYDLLNNRLPAALFGAAGLEAKVGAALASVPALPVPNVQVPKLDAGETYVLRCVYERAQCDPAHRYVSRPSEPFQLAPFFDPEAPARDIRVGLPVDVSIAGLRKFKKNVAFMMSKELRNKLESLSGKEEDVLDNNASVSDPGINIGHICSFSLPIITLCAFILLMIIVILLNLVFWWIPLLRICFPLKLSAK